MGIKATDHGLAAARRSGRLLPGASALVCGLCLASTVGGAGRSKDIADDASPKAATPPPTSGGWHKHKGNPVLGGRKYGTIFDVSVVPMGGEYWMYVSWRPKKSIALSKSRDGVHWSEPQIVLPPAKTGWEDQINRPGVVYRDGVFHLWYTGQAGKRSKIGYATSKDGVSFTRRAEPVLAAEIEWEKPSVMCPHVEWDGENRLFRMWYSGGEDYEPDAIGYATSKDGIRWKKYASNPIFKADPERQWERDKVTACQVVRHGEWYVMFYIGFEHRHLARIGLARSRDGVTGWQRHPANPIISPTPGAWDGRSCYKPFAVFDRANNRWLLWYNGRNRGEQIGLAIHDREDLGWQASARPAAAESRGGAPARHFVMATEKLDRYVDRFNGLYPERIVNYVPNARAKAFLRANVPLFECSDRDIEQTYYFRWWTYRKHIKKTPDGFVITEFLPKVGWSGKHNTISCPAGHHFYEGRWLHEAKYLDDYAVFWFRKGGEPRRYSFWAADAMWARYLVRPDKALVTGLLDDLVANYQAWVKSRLGANGLFWQIDDRDGMEVSIGGSGYRATINSYMYGDAVAIAKIARLARRDKLAKAYQTKADRIKKLVQERLWDAEAQFFKVLPWKGRRDRTPAAKLADVRELHGYVPWYFNLPDGGYEQAWRQLMDPKGFYAPFGPTTAERRHPRFRFAHGHDCQWNGPSWPYATTQTLVAMANVLNNYEQSVISKKDYFTVLSNYARSHRRAGKPWIAENLDGVTGKWIADKPRSLHYNHSAFCDLVITGLVGLRPGADETLAVNPLVPPGGLEYFCLDNVLYHARCLTILWDKTGRRYGKGKGLKVFVDGRQVAARQTLGPVTCKLPGSVRLPAPPR